MERRVFEPKWLNERGQCCGRKPISYKRPPHLFCPRCDAAFNLDGEQIENWAFKATGGGGFIYALPHMEPASPSTSEAPR